MNTSGKLQLIMTKFSMTGDKVPLVAPSGKCVSRRSVGQKSDVSPF